MRVLFAGGGSIGHVAPCVAVWRAIQKTDSSAQAFFICSSRVEEAEFLQKELLEFIQLPVRNPSPLRPFSFFKSLIVAWSTVSVFRPDVLFSKGGAVSIPAAIVCALRGIPVVLHESDAVSGRANKIVSLWATKICKGFPSPSPHPKPSPATIFTGNPIRSGIIQGSKDEGKKITGLTGTKPVMIVTGGSQGASALNDAVIRHLDQLLEYVQIIHLTGPGKLTETKRDGYWARAFAHDELAHLYAMADLALCRSGAGSIAEFAACGIPMILVPLRGVAHDHQQVNARAAVAGGGCVLLDQEDLSARLVPLVRELAGDAHRRSSMAGLVRSLSHPRAADELAGVLRSVMKGA